MTKPSDHLDEPDIETLNGSTAATRADQLLLVATALRGGRLNDFDRTLLVEIASMLPTSVDHIDVESVVGGLRLTSEDLSATVRRSAVAHFDEIEFVDDGVVIQLT